MTDLRCTLSSAGLIVHDGLYSRPPTPAEAELIRDALESPPLSGWLCAAAVVLCIAMLVVFARGGGGG